MYTYRNRNVHETIVAADKQQILHYSMRARAQVCVCV
jgi:hypothetical protein